MNLSGLGNLDDLFQSAQDDGLTQDTLDLVVANLNGPTMVGAVGVSLDDLASNDVTLAMNIIDMSGSMSPHAADLVRAYNQEYLTAMAGSAVADDILISTILFNHQVKLLHGYVNLADAPQLTPQTYTPDGTTALYDAVAGGLTNMVLYAQQLRQSGVMVRGLVLVYSDGEDNASRQKAADIRRTAEDLLKQEIYTLAFVGFVNGKPMGFNTNDPVKQIAQSMGFPEALRTNLSQHDLRRIFHLASLSTVRVSQGGAAPAAVFGKK